MIHHLVIYKALIKQVFDCWLNKISYFETYFSPCADKAINHLIVMIICRDTATQ